MKGVRPKRALTACTRFAAQALRLGARLGSWGSPIASGLFALVWVVPLQAQAFSLGGYTMTLPAGQWQALDIQDRGASALPSASKLLVNLSPKGQDSLRVTGPNEVLWMNLTGSGNETAAHLLENDRMTLMWCAFECAPMILRVYGTARAAHPRDAEWAACAAQLPSRPGARQYFRVAVDLVQTS